MPTLFGRRNGRLHLQLFFQQTFYHWATFCKCFVLLVACNQNWHRTYTWIGQNGVQITATSTAKEEGIRVVRRNFETETGKVMVNLTQPHPGCLLAPSRYQWQIQALEWLFYIDQKIARATVRVRGYRLREAEHPFLASHIHRHSLWLRWTFRVLHCAIAVRKSLFYPIHRGRSAGGRCVVEISFSIKSRELSQIKYNTVNWNSALNVVLVNLNINDWQADRSETDLFLPIEMRITSRAMYTGVKSTSLSFIVGFAALGGFDRSILIWCPEDWSFWFWILQFDMRISLFRLECKWYGSERQCDD